MAAELGKLAEAVRPYNRDYAELLSTYSTIFLSEGKIPMSLTAEEGKKTANPEADSLGSIALRLRNIGYKEGSDFLYLQNLVFNSTGMLTDKMQKKLIIRSKKPFSTNTIERDVTQKRTKFGGKEIFSTQKVKPGNKFLF